MEQMTKEQAVEFYQSGAWESMTLRERAVLQIEQNLLCMPFPVFHAAIENALGRGVYTHEFKFNRAGLRAELNGEAEAPTLSQIIAMIPCDKGMIVLTD